MDTLDFDKSTLAYEQLQESAEEAGQAIFETMQQAHMASIAREEERGLVAFNSRRKAIERIGLPEFVYIVWKNVISTNPNGALN